MARHCSAFVIVLTATPRPPFSRAAHGYFALAAASARKATESMLNRDWFIKSAQVSETAGTKWSQWPKTRSLIEQRHLEVGGIFHCPPAIRIDLERAQSSATSIGSAATPDVSAVTPIAARTAHQAYANRLLGRGKGNRHCGPSRAVKAASRRSPAGAYS